MRLTEHAARMGEIRNVYNTYGGEPEKRRLLGRPRCK
jgi:hypothetical protein